MSKKVLVFSLFAILFLSSFVSAATWDDSLKTFGAQVWNVVEPVARFVLGGATGDAGPGVTAGPELFMGRIILFIILLSLVWFAVKQFPQVGDNKSLVWIISVGVAILGVRFMQDNWVQTVILPYTALGIAITAIFPLIVYFFFVEKGLQDLHTMRKIAWIFAAVVFVVLFVFRVDNVQVSGSDATTFDPAWVYLIAAAACILFLWLDGTIQKWYARARADVHAAQSKKELEIHYKRLISQAHADITSNPPAITQEQYRERVQKYKDAIAALK